MGDKIGGNADPPAGTVYRGPGIFKPVEHVLVRYNYTGLLKYGQGGIVYPRYLIIGQDS
jgi:hypothetical protein